MSSLEEEIAALEGMPTHELRIAWHRLDRTAPPRCMPRDLMIRALAYRVQERAHGGPTPATKRKLRSLVAELEAKGTQVFDPGIALKPGARLTLEGHADPRGSVQYNQALSQRRVDRVKGFLSDLGVPAANIQTEGFGKQENLTDKQVKAAVERNPELSSEDRQKILDHMRTIVDNNVEFCVT